MTFDEFERNVFYATKDLEISQQWRFNNQETLWETLDISYGAFKQNMSILCDECYFSAIQDGPATHYIVKNKPQ